MLLEGLSNSILRWLRIPPGTSLRHAGEVGTSSSVNVLDNEYIDTIVGITVDDVCIGESPLSVDFADITPEEIQTKLKEVCDEFNTVVKDVAWDLCTIGYSVYTTDISEKNKLVLLPYVENVTFYLTKEKKVVACDEEANPLENVIIFLNYNRRCLTKIEDKELSSAYAFGINPEPMQLKNVQSTLNSLIAAENNLDRYRALSSRPIRLVNVDIGSAQGEQQKDVVDTIASAINANSGSLPSVSGVDTYDDNIPILPNRRGLGKAEVYDNIPAYDLSELGDIDHYMSKLTLVTRFPGSYMDFSKNLDETTASLLRGDIRYYKMCNKIRSKIVDTLNEFVDASEKFRKYEPCFVLTQLPTSEDEDVMNALDTYVDLATKTEEFVMSEGNSKDICLHRLQLLQDLFASSTTSPMLQKWFEDYREFIDKMDESELMDEGEEGMPGDLGGGPDLGGPEDLGGGPELDLGEGPEEPMEGETGGQPMEFVNEGGGPSDVEFVNEPLKA